MTDTPIIFSAPMVLALLAGRKTMTRRLAWQKPQVAIQVGDGPIEPILVASTWQKVKVGDRLWVREAFGKCDQCDAINMLADINLPRNCRRCDSDVGKGKPSIHMPRHASRLTLTVVAVKIEKLQEISEEDAIAEGIEREGDAWLNYDPNDPNEDREDGNWLNPIDSFGSLWRSLHGADGWHDDPTVVPLSFRVEKVNIDKAPAA